MARGTMPLGAHLGEARRRGTRAAVALVVCAIVGYLFTDQILDVLRTPVDELAASRRASLNYDTVTGAFDLKLKIALFAGIVLSSPVWMYQFFAFVVPGMTRREKSYAAGFVATAVPLFLTGAVFGLVLFPHVVEVLIGFSSDQDSTILTATYYVDFVMKFVVAIGLAFVLPLFLVMLNFIGVLSAARMRRGWRVAVVAIALFSGLVTPAADLLSMFFVAIPMTALFGVGVAVAHVHDRRALRRAAAADDLTALP